MLSPVEQIKERLDIVEVIQGYIQLTKAGVNYRACCPFHNEKTPSFTVSPAKQIWHCFGCNLGGDAFTFIQQIEGVEFKDALRILADKAGIKLLKQDPKLISQKEKFENVLKEASIYFQNQLINTQEGRLALDYLLNERGLKKESIDKFSIGYAENKWEALSNFLLSQGFKKEDIIASGLAFGKDGGSGRILDRFKGRIMFPIANHNGRIAGFTGRMFEKVWKEEEKNTQGKYVNTPQTLLFNKSYLLYGLDKAKTAIRKANSCILVEGQMDVIASHQAGVENAVASSGTALTLEQLQIIKRLTENIILAFDMDEAGLIAAQRGIDLALNLGFNINVAANLRKKDAADLVKEDPGLWREAIGNPLNIMDFYFGLAFKDFNPESAESKKKAAAKVLPVIARISNAVERAHYIHKLSEKLKVSEKVLENAISTNRPSSPNSQFQNRQNRSRQDAGSIQKKIKSKRELLEEQILSILVGGRFKDLSFFTEKGFGPDDFKSGRYNDIADCIWKILKEEKKIDYKELEAEFIEDQEAKRALNFLAITAENSDSDNFAADFKKSIHELQILSTKEILKSISDDIKEAENNKDGETRRVLVEEFNKYMKKLAELESC